MKLYLNFYKINIIIIFLFFIYFIYYNKDKFLKKEHFDTNNINNTIINKKLKNNSQAEEVINLKENLNDNDSLDDNTKKEQKSNNFFESYGPTNYPEPKDMSEQQRMSFKYTYPNNMTLQDYVNWLLLYKDDTKILSKNHFINLSKLLRGERLVYLPGVLPPPNRISPPLTSKDFFDNCYLDKTQIMNPRINSIPNRETGPIIPYNYIDYSTFNQNYDVYGLKGRHDLNPDLADKNNLKNFKTLLVR
jgi:hypothetical protein